MRIPNDGTLLTQIDRALAEPGWLPAVPAALRDDYTADRLEQCRLFNRRVLVMLTLIFDVYWVGEFTTAPDIVALSGLLRFGLMTPAVLLFLALDRQGLVGRHYGGWLMLITVTPALISAVLSMRTMAPAALLDIHATPLLLLGAGIAVRMPLRELMITTAVITLVYIISLFCAPVVPPAEIGSLALLELSIAAAAIGFNLQLEWRDRRMFLLNASDQIMRGLLDAANQGLVREALTDPLTGVANRRCFDDTLATFWQRGAVSKETVGLIMADIDYFKLYNDHYGHLAGDDCLRRVALRIAGLIREEDVLARYGGEEFAILLPDATPETVRGVAERVREGVEALGLAHAGLSPPGIVTVSLGYGCIAPHHGAIMRDLIAIADGELYTAKRSGRNVAICTLDGDGRAP